MRGTKLMRGTELMRGTKLMQSTLRVDPVVGALRNLQQKQKRSGAGIGCPYPVCIEHELAA